MSLIIPPSQSLVASGYDIDNSCRFDKASSARLYKSMTLPTNYTISCWVKRSNLSGGTVQYVYRFSAEDNLSFGTTDKLQLERRSGKSIATNRFCRDTSAWMHFVVIASASNFQLFINGSEHNYSDGGSYSRSGGGSTSGSDFQIGMHEGASGFFDGYIAEFHLLDGIAVSDATDFGEVDETYGHWKPKEYEGSYGTNGFYLDFSTSANLGDDKSGSSNDFTATNLAASDQMLDTPTNNFCTANVLDRAGGSYVFKQGNLHVFRTGGDGFIGGTMGVSSGKWYFELLMESSVSNYPRVGIWDRDNGNDVQAIHYPNEVVGAAASRTWGANGTSNGPSSDSATAPTYTNGDILQFAIDIDNQKLHFGKNNTWYSTGTTTVTSAAIANNSAAGTFTDLTAGSTWEPCIFCNNSADNWFLNCGQDATFSGNETGSGGPYNDGDYGSFYYQPPSGFLALCTKNLPDPTVTPSEHFNTILYTGTGSSNARTGVGFQPDLVWIKNRETAYSHQPYDSVRGVQKKIHINNDGAETTDSTGLTAFGSDGFTVGSNVGINENTKGQVAWCWKANGSGSSNEDGSINTTATSANVAGGFSISTYTGTGSNATVGHGLSKAPELVIVKIRSGAAAWMATSVQPVASLDFTDYLVPNENYAAGDNATIWNDTAPTASVFSVGTNGVTNGSSSTYLAYCWHSVEGYSKVGAYTGNANRDGTFIYLGFRPAFVMIKNVSASANWVISDSARDPNNKVSCVSRPDINNADYCGSDAYFAMDFLSNGIKLRENDAWFSNATTYLYIAFAETPFKYANAR